MIFLGKHAGNPNKRVVGRLASFPEAAGFPAGKCATSGDGKDRAHFRSGGAHFPAFQQRGGVVKRIMVFSDWHHKNLI